MILIEDITIESFRSISYAEIRSLADLTTFAGLNNSGKSNVLRALNAFFNDQTDFGQSLNIDADYYRPDQKKKKRKRIRISVTFNLPDNFKFRKGLEGAQSLIGQETKFKVTKEWVRDEALPSFFLNDALVKLEDRQKILSFLQLVKFRYVPNRVLPVELIKNEHQALRDVLVRRLAQRAKGDIKAFEAIRATSERMVESLSERFMKALPNEGVVSLATPSSWSDLAFTFGYKLTKGDMEVSDSEQGSGIQSLLMLETLYLIDKDYFQQFGWKQAAVWGLEEPESSLHTSLEAQVAAYLAEVSADPKSRLQVLCTTHSDLMVQYSGATVLVTHNGIESELDTHTDPRKALKKLATVGVSRWVHPVLFSPLDPIILVEGKYDAEFLKQALNHIKPKRKVHVVDLPVLGEASGGVDSMHSYVKAHSSAISSRRPDAPVVVALDWDASNKLNSFQKLVKAPGIYKVAVWDAADANPKAGRTFRGIERFFSDRLINEAIKQNAAIAKKKSGEWVVDSADYGNVKQILAKIVEEGIDATDLIYSEKFLRSLLKMVNS